jgi:signal transduction histidine kinase
MALLFGLFMTASLAARFDAAVKAESRLRDDLAGQVQAQREELLALHHREQERHATLAAQRERHRIMQDMHDGLGAHLTGLLALAQRGALDSTQMAHEVAEAIDHLRLAVDSAGLEQASLADVLAQVRFRLSPRLAQMGLAVDWRLDDTPGELNPEQASHVQKIVLEALSNTLRHAQARHWRVHTGLLDGQVQLVLEDDGRGLPTAPQAANGTGRAGPPGNGLRHLQARAQALGATLHFERPEAGGLRLRLCWPPLQPAQQA